MANLLSIERYVPPYRYDQEVVSSWVRRWLDEEPGLARRLLSVYATAGVRTRASVVPIEQVFHPGGFEAQNRRYRAAACAAGVDVARRALASAELTPAEVDFVVSVSCTGFMIPSLDAYVADSLGMGPALARLPITESGCAGGVVALARVFDHLRAHPERAALVLAMELSSLTFQRWDRSPANVVSTAIFGDGGAAAVVVGERHRLAGRGLVRVAGTGSRFFPGSTHLMGFELRDAGLQIVLDRALAPFVRREVTAAVDGFLAAHGLERSQIARWILHPGGRRVIEVMAERLGLSPADLSATEAVLARHGNMSSVTVLFVLDEVLRCQRPAAGARGVLGAFGPGFSAELSLLEFL
jgi:alkylresorcinol/alkylpyrone synthase